jgi:hypothetical protein
MARPPWHPYAPDQAFGHQAAEDEELLDRTLARLEQQRRDKPPRAGGKARPKGERPSRTSPAGMRIGGWVGTAAGLPVTTNVALDAAARLLSEPD